MVGGSRRQCILHTGERIGQWLESRLGYRSPIRVGKGLDVGLRLRGAKEAGVAAPIIDPARVIEDRI